MKKFIFTILATILLLTSCKNDKKENNSGENKKEVVLQTPFTVTVNAIVKKDDVFQVYYNEDGKDTFAAEQAVTIATTGKEEAQDIVFTFPEAASPTSLRFDLGANKDQQSIKIISFKINYLDKAFEIAGIYFPKYFTPNPQIEFDSPTSTAKIIIDPKVMYDPIFLPTLELKKEIVKLYK